MSYLIDTDVIIDFLKNQNSAYFLFEKIATDNLMISIITWVEVEYGIKKSPNPEKRKAEFMEMLDSFSIKIAPIDSHEASEFVKLKIELEKKKFPLADFDLFIAATAVINGLTLVTSNTKHFSRISKLKLFSSFK